MNELEEYKKIVHYMLDLHGRGTTDSAEASPKLAATAMERRASARCRPRSMYQLDTPRTKIAAVT